MTAALDFNSWSYFEDLRRAHFPPERNVLAAHVTLFHRLAGEHEDRVACDLAEEASTSGPMAGRVARLRSLGTGVAFNIDCSPLVELRQRLRERWVDLLGPQDRTWRQPHVTVQNKVTPLRAEALLTQLQTTFVPFGVEITGVTLWRYVGGPWALIAQLPFRGSTNLGLAAAVFDEVGGLSGAGSSACLSCGCAFC